MARMNTVIHDMEADIRLGDTMRNPAFKDKAGKLQQFDLVTANPMWNQNFPTKLYENDPYERFIYGIPPESSADWSWLQHMLASLNDRGRMAVVLDTGAVSRGSGNQASKRLQPFAQPLCSDQRPRGGPVPGRRGGVVAGSRRGTG